MAFFTQNTVLKRPFKLVKFVKAPTSERYEPREVKNFWNLVFLKICNILLVSYCTKKRTEILFEKTKIR